MSYFIDRGPIELSNGEKTKEFTLTTAGKESLVHNHQLQSLQKRFNEDGVKLYERLDLLAEFLRPLLKIRLLDELRANYPDKSFHRYPWTLRISHVLKGWSGSLELMEDLIADGAIYHRGSGWYRVKEETENAANR